MTRKKSRFLAFCFSLLPGAGEMYLGFMKQGVSMMGFFWGAISVSSLLDYPALLFLLPLIWFYSFFNANNLASLPDEEFYAMEDRYLIFSDLSRCSGEQLERHRKILAIVLIFFGFSMLWRLFTRFLLAVSNLFLPQSWLTRLITSLSLALPQLVVAVGIIYLGLVLIRGARNHEAG